MSGSVQGIDSMPPVESQHTYNIYNNHDGYWVQLWLQVPVNKLHTHRGDVGGQCVYCSCDAGACISPLCNLHDCFESAHQCLT